MFSSPITAATQEGDLVVSSEGLGRGCTFTATFALGLSDDRFGDNDHSSNPEGSQQVLPPATSLSSSLQSSGGDVFTRMLANANAAAAAAAQGHAPADSAAPVRPSSSTNTTSPSQSHPGSIRLPRVCFAEDDALLRRVTAMTLKMAQLDADVFPDGRKATDAVARDLTEYALVILDANMGGGDLDGLPALQRICELYAASPQGAGARPPVVILTGEADPAVHQAFTDAGAARVLVKPAKAEHFKELRKLITQHRGAAGGGGRHPRTSSTDRLRKSSDRQRRSAERLAAPSPGPSATLVSIAEPPQWIETTDRPPSPDWPAHTGIEEADRQDDSVVVITACETAAT